jgi:hypothetical protein
MSTKPIPCDQLVLAAHLNDLRSRVAAGEDVPPEEYAEIIASIRQTRLSAASAAAHPAKKRGLSVAIDPDSLADL